MLRPLNAIRRAGFCCALLLLAALVQAQESTASKLIDFEIRRQALATALLDFSYQSDVQVVMPGFLAEGLLAPALIGRFSATEALSRLLARSGLEYSFTSERTVTIRPVASGLQVSPRRRRWLEQLTQEQMFVVAQERRDIVRDVSISMSALSGEDLESRGVTKADELQQFVPGLTVEAPQSGNTEFSIRAGGISNDDIATQSGVAVIIDDIYIPRQSAANMALYELDQVEVLRGPQSVLYARNATGGTLIYTTRKPTSDFEARYAVDKGEEGLFNNQLTLNGELSDSVSGRISVASFQRDTIMDNLNAGAPDGNNIDSTAGRGTLRWVASNEVEWLLSLDGESTEQDAVLYSLGPQASFRFTPSLPAVDASEPTRSANVDGATAERLELEGGMLRANVSTSFYTAHYIFGRRSHRLGGTYDLDQTPVLLMNKAFSEVSDSRSFEARWMSPQRRSGQETQAGELGWLVGMSALQEQAEVGKELLAPGLAAGVNSWRQHLTDHSYSAYGQLEYFMTNRLQLIAGIRYAADFRAYELSADTTAPGSQNPYLQEDYVFKDRRDWRRLTPKLALHYQRSPETSLYLSASSAYKPGGFLGTPATFEEAGQPFDSERVSSVEAGLRSNWFANRIKFNMAAFSSTFRDMQVMGNDEVGKSFVTTADRAEVNGFEMEIQARPLAALRVGVGMSVIDTEFERFFYRKNTASGVQVIDKAGDSIPRVPNTTLNLSVVYLFADTASGAWSWRTDALYSQAADDINNDRAWVDYRNYNLWFDYLPHTGKWEAALWVRNLRDNINFQASAPGVSASESAFARKLEPPRIIGASLKYYW